MANDKTGADEISRAVSRAEKRLRWASGEGARKAGPPGAGTAGGDKRKHPFPFKVEAGCLWREIEEDGEDGPRRRWVPFASELRVLALTRDENGEDWGRLLEIVDRDGTRHLWAMPAAMLAGNGEALRAELLSRGLTLMPGRKARDWLHEYLALAEPERRARCVSRIGWHGRSFVLPNETFAAIDEDGREDIILQTAEWPDHAFEVAGTLKEWRERIGRPARGNSRLVLAISAAFAAALPALTGDEGGGFHLRGASSCGKSTALMVAGSVWGGGGLRGFIRHWRATDNALEGVAAMACDALLCLDELAQIDPKAAGAAAYMLANGRGKARANRDGGPRRTQEWRVLFLSSGEMSLADKIAEGGGRGKAGMEVRVIDLPADAGAGLGLFETLHGAENAAAFADRLRGASGRTYGTAAREFLRQAVEAPEEWGMRIAKLRRDFVASIVPAGADGQVRRVAERFALVAAAGEIATQFEITGWEPGEAKKAAERCFGDWLASRGGSGAYETMEARRRLAEAIEIHGAARFQSWEPDPRRAVITQRYGFVKREGEGETVRVVAYFLTPSALRDILTGLDVRRVVEALCDEGVIRRQGGRANKVFHVPGDGEKHRLYEICPEALLGAREDGDA